MPRFIINSTDYIDFREAPGNTVEIVDILVQSNRRQGNGSLLVQMLINSIKEEYSKPINLYAFTRENNKIAQEFYTALGFALLGRLENFYPPEKNTEVYEGGETALLYRFEIEGVT